MSKLKYYILYLYLRDSKTVGQWDSGELRVRQWAVGQWGSGSVWSVTVGNIDIGQWESGKARSKTVGHLDRGTVGIEKMGHWDSGQRDIVAVLSWWWVPNPLYKLPRYHGLIGHVPLYLPRSPTPLSSKNCRLHNSIPSFGCQNEIQPMYISASYTSMLNFSWPPATALPYPTHTMFNTYVVPLLMSKIKYYIIS